MACILLFFKFWGLHSRCINSSVSRAKKKGIFENRPSISHAPFGSKPSGTRQGRGAVSPENSLGSAVSESWGFGSARSSFPAVEAK